MNKIKHSNVNKITFLRITFLTNEPLFIKPMLFEMILLKLLQRQ